MVYGYFRLVIAANSLFSRCTPALRPMPLTPIAASFFFVYASISFILHLRIVGCYFSGPPSIHSELLRNHGHQDYKEIGKTKQVILLIGGCNFHIEAGTYLSHYNIFNNGCITIIYHNHNISTFIYKLIVSVNLQHTLLTLQFKKLHTLLTLQFKKT